jgi:SHS2 domain-containing protein
MIRSRHPEPNPPATQSGWEHFHHDTEIGVRGIGRNMVEAFEQAAIAITALVCDPRQVRSWREVDVSCRNEDREWLFFDWIDAIVHEMTSRQMLFSEFQVTIHENELKARLHGEPISQVRHHPAVVVKGASVSELLVRHKHDRWTAQCVVNIEPLAPPD